LSLQPSLIERARAGDRSAQSEFLQENYEYVHRLLGRLVGWGPEVDDLCQTVLIAIIDSLPSYEGRSSVTTWIGGICVNVARSHRRRQRKLEQRVVAHAHTDADTLRGRDTTADFEDRERLGLVMQALAKLSASQRAVFVLRVFGHTIDEIASMTRAAASTTRLRLYYGRRKFFRALAALEARPPPAEVAR
jgi:RNA polymerase sigma-70 factor (ECF subfamily)